MSLGYDIPSAKNISPSITVSKPSDAVSTKDVYSSKIDSVTNYFQPLKLSTDVLKKNMSQAVNGLQTSINKSDFKNQITNASTTASDFLKSAMTVDSRVNNAVKGFLDGTIIKSIQAVSGNIAVINGIAQKIKSGDPQAIIKLFNTATGLNINSNILNKGPLQAMLTLVFGEASKNKMVGLWGEFKNSALFELIGLDITRSLAKNIVRYGDVELLKDISEDAYKYALLEADSRLLYNFAAYYKLPANATNEQINDIFTKFNTAANNLRPNWYFITVNGVEQIDGYFVTYGSYDFLKMIQVYASKNVPTKYDEDTMLLNGDINDVNNPFTIDVQMNSSMKAAGALYGLISNTSFAKVTTKAHISNVFGLAV